MKRITSSTLYYSLRIVQRWALLVTGLVTVIHWVVLLSITISTTMIGQQTNHGYRNPQLLNDTIRTATDRLYLQVTVAAAVATILTLAMLCMPRVRQFEKRLVIDSLVIVVFCWVSVALSQPLVQTFINTYLT